MKHLWTLVLAGSAFGGPVGDPAPATFYRDVLPVLQQHCQTCHRPGEAAPMSFLTFESTRPWAKGIRQAVLLKRMPPWSADAPHGTFANDPSLSPAEIETLVKWVDTGAQQGDPGAAPHSIQFVEGWNIGRPDVVMEMPRAFNVPAAGAVEYQHVIMPTGFTEDRWVQAVEIRPGNRAAVHHIIAFVREPGSRWLRDALPGVPVLQDKNLAQLPLDEIPEFLLSYTPGRPPAGLPEGQARLIKAGSDIVLQLHYTTNGKPATDQSKIGFIFAKQRPAERVATLPLLNPRFAIPPGDPNYRVDAAAVVQQPARLLRMIPHMHQRGRTFEYRLADADGPAEVLLRVPRYDFQWQHAYALAQPVTLKPGSRVECTGWFDNSPNNPWNPNPNVEVHWGDQSWDEMMVGYIDVAVAANAEPRRVLAPAAAAQITATSAVKRN